MHPEVVNTDSNGDQTLLEDDVTFVAAECPNDRKAIIEHSRSSDNSASLERTKAGTKKLIIEGSMINRLSKDDSNMKLEVLKIALDPISIIGNGSARRDNNNIKYSQPGQGDENNDSNAGGRPYVCYICGKVFSRNSSLKCHIRLHLEGPVSVLRKNGNQAVNETRSDKDDILKHSNVERDDEAPLTEQISNDGGPHECEQCGRLFNCKRGLYRHHGYHNKKENRLSKTDDAGSDIDLSLADENLIGTLEDENSILGTGDFECVTCGKNFRTARAMKIHAYHAHKKSKLSHDLNLIDDAENLDEEDDELKFKCQICGRLFESQRSVSIHATRVHKLNGNSSDVNHFESSDEDEVDELFQCHVCAKYFKTSRAVKIHASHKHPDMKCVEEEEEQNEQLSEDEEQAFYCDYCDRVFHSQRARSIHAKSAHRLNGKQMQEMNARKSDNFQENDKNDNDLLECSVCEKKFPSVQMFETHTEGVCGTAQILGNSDDYVYVCQHCPKTFAHPKSMSRHMRVHNLVGDEESDDDENDGGKRYQCAHCDKSYSNKQAYAGHCKAHTNKTGEDTSSDEESVSLDDEAEYKCPLCEKTYSNKQALAGHIKVHTDRDRSLPVSMKVSTNHVITRVSEGKSTVNKQSTIEKEGRIYECKYCGRTFSASVGYAGHMKAHRAEIAADTASHASTVTHSPSSKRKRSESMSDSDDDDDNDKRFSCRYCNKKFASSVILGAHVRQHIADMKANPKSYTPVHPNIVEDKVYKCDACMQTFTYLSELKIHTANGCIRKGSSGSQNDNDLLKCEYCEQTFLLRCHLQKHIKSRCHVNDVPTHNFVNGDSEDVLPNKRVRKSTFMSSMYEYEPIIKIPRKSAQKSNEFHDSDDERLSERDRIPAEESEEVNDEYYENDIEFPASEQFVIQTQNGEEEGFVFEQYDDSQGYQCNECEETYRDKLQMMIHMSFHFRNRFPNGGCKSLTIKADSTLLAPYKCDFCEERFINKKYRKRHLCKRHSDDIYKCDICEKLFLYKNTLKQHCKQHMIETKYHCEYCRKCFTSEWFLKRHTRRQCEKRLALEELTQSPSQTEVVECTQTDSIIDLQPEIPCVENLDYFVREEEIYID